MIECDVLLTFQVGGPYLSRSSTTGGFGIDATPLRDRLGRPLLPGSHVRGRIRETLADVWNLGPRPAGGDEWLGPIAAREDIQENNGLRRFGWYFGDFTAEAAASTGEHYLTRIQLDKETGSVKTGAMLVIECAVPPGETASFSGIVTVSAADEGELKDVLRWLRVGAAGVPSVGSYRNVGFGRVAGVSTNIQSIRNWNGALDAATLTGLGVEPSANDICHTPGQCSDTPPLRTGVRRLRVQMKEPFCVGGKRTDRNTIGSLRHLSGAVLKGAVAHQVQKILGVNHRVDLAKAPLPGRWALLCKHFAGIRFCTAFACKAAATSRPLVTPQSLFKGIAGEAVRDASLVEGPFLAKNEQNSHVAPAFAPDWKSFVTTGWDTGLADPDVELRIRTAIDSKERRVKDEHLFAMELVQNRHTVINPKTGVAIRHDDLNWLGTVSLEGLKLSEDEKNPLWDDLDALLGKAVFRIGKTKARARFVLEDLRQDDCFAASVTPHKEKWVVVLQSPALLIDPKALHDKWADGVDATAQLYADTFRDLSGGSPQDPSLASLRLLDHFADQQLHGGFLAHRSDPHNYSTLLTTEAGTFSTSSRLARPSVPATPEAATMMLNRTHDATFWGYSIRITT